MSTLKEKIASLNNMVLSGRALEAFETFYHNDVVMQENNQTPTVGKAANRSREEDFFAKADGFFDNAAIKDVAVGDNVTMVRWHYHYHHAEWGTKDYEQVSVQHWKDGLIVKEQFFYGN